MEMGSFIELQYPKGMEYYANSQDMIRLNNGRAGIWHALRVIGASTIWLPYYQCDTVRDFLYKKHINIKYYHIDNKFDPVDLDPSEEDAVLFVNYYGIMSPKRMKKLAEGYKNVIIDNCQAFFSEPLEDCLCVYSCRKFIGVPDGAYVIGKNADKYADDYEQCYSSDTSLFLLQRMEYGCEGKAYESRKQNEQRIDREDCMIMSELTRKILDGTDYDFIRSRRIENFNTAANYFDKINCLDATEYYDVNTVPMVYPLVIEDEGALECLQKAKHFQGHWWSYLCGELPENTVEHWISRYMIPITIDQRYGEEQLTRLRDIILGDRW